MVGYLRGRRWPFQTPPRIDKTVFTVESAAAVADLVTGWSHELVTATAISLHQGLRVLTRIDQIWGVLAAALTTDAYLRWAQRNVEPEGVPS